MHYNLQQPAVARDLRVYGNSRLLPGSHFTSLS